MTTERAAVILHQGDETQTVQLSADYTHDATQTTARFLESGARITFFAVGRKTKQFWLSEQEADAFCTSWLEYQRAKREKAEAEAAAEQKLIDEALEVAATCPLLTVTEKPAYGHRTWHLQAEKLGNFYREAHSPQQLKGHVDMAITFWEQRKAANDIVAACPAIQVKGSGSAWFVSIPKPELFGEWAYDTKQLLERVTRARDIYEEHQQKHAKEHIAQAEVA